MRIMALWFPDWPIQAVQAEQNLKLTQPIAIVTHFRIKACAQSARLMGVRRGMRVRQAQALCPELEVISDDQDRDTRVFESIIASLDDVASSVEVLRPGLVVVDAGAVARYFGTEEKAAQLLIDSSSRAGIDVIAAVADDICTAIIATRTGVGNVVREGASKSFLKDQPMSVLAAEEALGCDATLVQSFRDLGLKTLGDLAEIPIKAVVNRFGQPGLLCHNIASARRTRKVAPPISTTEWAVNYTSEPPINSIDTAAFIARSLAVKLQQKLAYAGLISQVLRITAEFSDGSTLTRMWRTQEPLTESVTADRIRWQLNGWLTNRSVSSDEEVQDTQEQGIRALELLPLECVPPAMARAGLWDSGVGDEHALVARQVIERVQSTLGIEAVVQPVPAGGRGVAERITFVPYGEQRDPVRHPEGTWIGRIPAPLPAHLGRGLSHPASRVRLISAEAQPIILSENATLDHQPYALIWGENRYLITGWAGPWPVDDRWWEADGKKYARLQVAGQKMPHEEAAGHSEIAAWLLIWINNSWRIEANY